MFCFFKLKPLLVRHFQCLLSSAVLQVGWESICSLRLGVSIQYVRTSQQFFSQRTTVIKKIDVNYSTRRSQRKSPTSSANGGTEREQDDAIKPSQHIRSSHLLLMIQDDPGIQTVCQTLPLSSVKEAEKKRIQEEGRKKENKKYFFCFLYFLFFYFGWVAWPVGVCKAAWYHVCW